MLEKMVLDMLETLLMDELVDNLSQTLLSIVDAVLVKTPVRLFPTSLGDEEVERD